MFSGGGMHSVLAPNTAAAVADDVATCDKVAHRTPTTLVLIGPTGHHHESSRTITGVGCPQPSLGAEEQRILESVRGLLTTERVRPGRRLALPRIQDLRHFLRERGEMVCQD